MWEQFLLVMQGLGIFFTSLAVVKVTTKLVKMARAAQAVHFPKTVILTSVAFAKMIALGEVAKVKAVVAIAGVLIGIVRDQVVEVRNTRGVTTKVRKALLAMVVVGIAVPRTAVVGAITLAKVVAMVEVSRVKTAWASAKGIAKLVKVARLRNDLTSPFSPYAWGSHNWWGRSG